MGLGDVAFLGSIMAALAGCIFAGTVSAGILASERRRVSPSTAPVAQAQETAFPHMDAMLDRWHEQRQTEMRPLRSGEWREPDTMAQIRQWQMMSMVPGHMVGVGGGRDWIHDPRDNSAERPLDPRYKKVSEDDTGALYVIPQQAIVEVTNGSPEPDGKYKKYRLTVHPELRPMLPDGRLGEPQPLTPRNAVASTYGMRGEEYQVSVRT